MFQAKQQWVGPDLANFKELNISSSITQDKSVNRFTKKGHLNQQTVVNLVPKEVN